MLQIETRGSWREMGCQLGEAFRPWFPRLLEHFASWLARDVDRYRPRIDALRRTLREHCPEIEEETDGPAEALGWERDLTLGFRFFNELRLAEPGCSGVYVCGAEGPLLGRTCDIEPDIGAEIQLCRVSRPSQGLASVVATYLGLTGGVGFNEAGLAMTGSSASMDVPPAREGTATAVFCHLVMSRCRTLADVRELASRHRMNGKGAIMLACDVSGASALIELVPGMHPTFIPRPEGREWQACSNFPQSRSLRPLPSPEYLENAYCRYGRLVQQLGDGHAEPSVAGVKQLLLDVAQPGLVCHEPHCAFHTAYAFVVELKRGVMHLCPGHPAKTPWQEVSL